MILTSVARQFQAAFDVSETDYSSGAIGEWYSMIMEHDETDLDLIKANVATGAFVVDLMCGRGRVLRRLLAAGYDGRGVDINPEAVEAARQSMHFEMHFVHGDAFRWLPEQTPDAVYMGGLIVSMFDLSAVDRLLSHVRSFLRPGGHIFFDFLPTVENQSGWRGDFVVPIKPQGSGSFVITSTQRDEIKREQITEFYLHRQDQSAIQQEFACHYLRLHKTADIEVVLSANGFDIKSVIDSYQFDEGGIDHQMPYWPVRKLHAQVSQGR